MGLNVVDLQTYFKQQIIEKLDNAIDPKLLTFEHSKDDGIYLDLKDGQYLLSVGKNVTLDQANRVLTVIYMDITMGVKNEDERMDKGYSEFSTAVAKQKTKFFPPTHVWILKDGVILKDKLIEEFKTQVQTEKFGKIDKDHVYGLRPKEIRLSPKE